MNEEQLKALKSLISDLVSGNFDSIQKNGRNGRLSLSEIKTALAEYPGTLSIMPDNAFQRASYYPRNNHEDSLGSADVNLWFDGERSDLTLLVDFTKQDGIWHIAIDDIHVL